MPGNKGVQFVPRHLAFPEISQYPGLKIIDYSLFGHITKETRLVLISQIRKLEQPVRRDAPSCTLEDLHSLWVGCAEYQVIACLVVYIEHPEGSATPTRISKSLLILCNKILLSFPWVSYSNTRAPSLPTV